MYVYIESERWREQGRLHQLFTVGFYKPDGKFEAESDHSKAEEAANRVHWLNGGIPAYELQMITQINWTQRP